MKLIPTFSVLILLCIFSCKDRVHQGNHHLETPTALEDKSFFGAFSKDSLKGRGDLISQLYEELVEKNLALRNLEKDIDNLYEDPAGTKLLLVVGLKMTLRSFRFFIPTKTAKLT